jgi:hypothetical protein
MLPNNTHFKVFLFSKVIEPQAFTAKMWLMKQKWIYLWAKMLMTIRKLPTVDICQLQSLLLPNRCPVLALLQTRFVERLTRCSFEHTK